MDAFGLDCYLFEPEYTEEELRQRDEELARFSAPVVDTDTRPTTSNASNSSANEEECGVCTLSLLGLAQNLLF